MDSSKINLYPDIELYAQIKRSSKYYYQGLDIDNEPIIFQVDEVRNGSHPFRLNSNNYRAEDLVFYLKKHGEDQLRKL